MGRRAAVASVVGVVAAAFAVGCGGSDSAGDTTPDASGKPVANATIGMPSQFLTLDPDQSLDPPGQAVIRLMGGTLFELSDGKAIPVLAESAIPSSDGLLWTVTLRPGLTFSDGTPLTAADVKASLDRSIGDKRNVNPSLFGQFKTITAASPTVVKIALNSPYPDLTQLLTYEQLTVYPAARVGDPGFFKSPISAGPYMLDSFSANAAELTVNPKYAGSPPVVKSISMSVVPDANSALSQVQSGQLTMAYGLPPNVISVIPKNERQVVPSYGLEAALVSTTRPPLDDLAVRQAVSRAIDREQMSKLAWVGTVPALAQTWPQTLPGHDPSISTAPDLAGAKAALQGTSCANGCTLRVTYSTDIGSQAEQEAVAIQSDLKKIGVDVSLNKVDGTAWNDAYLNGSFSVLLSPLFVPGPIPDDIPTFAVSPGSTLYAGYPGMIAAMNKSISSGGAAKVAALRTIDAAVRENVPFIPLTGTAVVSASKSPDLVVQTTRLIGVTREDGSTR